MLSTAHTPFYSNERVNQPMYNLKVFGNVPRLDVFYRSQKKLMTGNNFGNSSYTSGCNYEDELLIGINNTVDSSYDNKFRGIKQFKTIRSNRVFTDKELTKDSKSEKMILPQVVVKVNTNTNPNTYSAKINKEDLES